MSVMQIGEIRALLPHRYPFLMVDRVLAIKPGDSIVALKNISVNEPQFTGHFPAQPIMPGVLMIEAMAQAAGILAFKSDNITLDGDATYYLAAVNKARFKRPVTPGDQLRIEARLVKRKRGIYIFDGACYTGQELAASAELMCTVK